MTTPAIDNEALDVGSIISMSARIITHERTLWYGDGLMTAAAGERRTAMPNIHTDNDYAKSQGLRRDRRRDAFNELDLNDADRDFW